MKGFGIYVKNDLLDVKHHKAMGASVWLYLWLLDKMTSVSDEGVGKVLGGKPIKYSEVTEELDLTERTYQRYIKQLRSAGYINTTKTMYGLIISVNKAEKIFSNRKVTTKMAAPVPPKSVKAPAKNVVSETKNGGTNKTIQLDNTKTIQVKTKVLTKKQLENRDPSVTQLISAFDSQVGKVHREQSMVAIQLIKQHGLEKCLQAVMGVADSRGQQYAPNIASLEELRDKWVKLENFYARQTNKRKTVHIS